ncbi:ankyrin repeat protein [Leptospira interrogans str. FPW1039]|uniref:Ankyrin repeat protein n=1 Tax=Leptospira interrogans str. FPW1039 TaxID=1193040 RepID=A0A0F6IIK8_LEPIR|nr:ankyrin repeat domain-containing protein [Leptospira interrogans]EMJ37883.1 ankyrin repeat protein [Leptospira interrogans str. FPW1039]
MQDLLLKAISAEDELQIQELIAKGADPNQMIYVRSLKVPLWFSALPISFSGGVKFKSNALRALLSSGADLNALSNSGESAMETLLYYCKDDTRFEESAKALLDAGIDLNAHKEESSSILRSAVYAKTASVRKVSFLLQAGADVNLADKKNGETPLIRACIDSDTNGEVMLEIVRLLIRAGADVNAQETWKGWSSLMWVAKHGNMEVAKLLAGANLKAESLKGDTNSYLIAYENKHQDFVSWLEEQGAKDTSDRMFRILQRDYIQKSAWSESVDAGLKAIKAFPEDGIVCNHLSFAYRNLGRYEDSVSWARRSLLFSFDLEALNLLIANYIHLQKSDLAILECKKYRTQILESGKDIGQVFTNLLVAYFIENRSQEAIDFLGDPWKIQTQESVFFLNLACIYVKLENHSSAIRSLFEAVRLKYPIEKLKKDEDLKPLTENTAFQILLKGNFERLESETFFLENDCVELVRDRLQVEERKMFEGKEIQRTRFEFSLPYEVLLKYAEFKDHYIQSGWELKSDRLSPVEEDLVVELDDVLKKFQTDQKIGAILLEWDYEEEDYSYYLCIETYQSLEKARNRYSAYQGTNKNTIFECNLETMYRIYSKGSFERVVERVMNGEGFRKKEKLSPFFFVHAEHDSGNEFGIERSISPS